MFSYMKQAKNLRFVLEHVSQLFEIAIAIECIEARINIVDK